MSSDDIPALPVPEQPPAMKQAKFTMIPIDTIYPGHPCLVVMQIMANYETVKYIYPAVLSNNRIQGSGAAISQAMIIIDLICTQTGDIDAAFEEAQRI